MSTSPKGQGDRAGEGTSGSRLLEQAVAPGAAHLAHSPAPVLNKTVVEFKRKFNLAMEDELLDYRHNHPIRIEDCANTLIKIFNNVIDQPHEPKFRQIKALSNAFKNNITAVKGGETLMTLAGWTTKVVEYQKFWVFEGGEEPGSTKLSILSECSAVLQRALHTIHEKAERQRKESQGKQLSEEQRKQQVLLQLEDDRAMRRLKAETTAITVPVAASKLPSEEPQRGSEAGPGHMGHMGGGGPHTAGQPGHAQPGVE